MFNKINSTTAMAYAYQRKRANGTRYRRERKQKDPAYAEAVREYDHRWYEEHKDRVHERYVRRVIASLDIGGE